MFYIDIRRFLWLKGVTAGSLYYNSALTSVAIAVGNNGSIYSSFDGTTGAALQL